MSDSFNPNANSEEFDIEALVAAVEAGTVERDSALEAIQQIANAQIPVPPILEQYSLEAYIADDPSRTDLKMRLLTVYKIREITPPEGFEEDLRQQILAEEYGTDFQHMLDDYGEQARYADMERDFFHIMEDVRAYSMTSVERLYALWTAVRYLIDANVPGAFVEAGVWRGGSVMLMAKEILRMGVPPRELWLYDTFSGLPEPDAELDVDILGNRAVDGWRPRSFDDDSSIWAYADETEVRANMASTGYPVTHQQYVVGKVEETLPGRTPKSIALLRIDTDWHASYAHVLETLYDRVVPGGIVIFDDYGHFKGARHAVDDFLAKRRIKLPLIRVDYSCRVLVKTGKRRWLL